LRSFDRDLATHNGSGPDQGLLNKVGSVEHGVSHAEFQSLLGFHHLVEGERVLNDDGDSVVQSGDTRQQRCTAPTWDEAEEHLGKGQCRGAGRHGAVGAVQGDFEAATHRCTVDERKARHRQRGELIEDAVAKAPDLEHLLVRGELAEDAEVGTDAEDERLAGETDRHEVVARSHRVEGGLQGRERRGAERVGALVVAAVVEGEQRRLAGAIRKVDVVDLRLGDDLIGEVRQCAVHVGHAAAHAGLPSPLWFGFSQMTVPPWPRPTHIVVMP
jgi:hypothetical protein